MVKIRLTRIGQKKHLCTELSLRIPGHRETEDLLKKSELMIRLKIRVNSISMKKLLRNGLVNGAQPTAEVEKLLKIMGVVKCK